MFARHPTITNPTLTCCDLFMVATQYPEAVRLMSSETLADVLAWNDANGDYQDMNRADLIAALRIQIEGAKS